MRVSLLFMCVGGLVAGDVMGDDARESQRAPADVVGVTHVASKYYFGEKDILNEGADRLVELGTRVIKVWFTDPQGSYRWNSEWPQMKSLVEEAQCPHFKELFSKPFTVFILETYSMGSGHYFVHGVSEKQKQDEERQFYELSSYLLKTYAGTGKRFVLQHWEGDWAIRGNYDAESEPTVTAIAGMIDWLNARQAGVDKARAEFADSDARVYHAAEVNLVVSSMKDGRKNVVNTVLPGTHCDLVSYSCYDAILGANIGKPEVLRDALDFIAKNTPDSAEFGDKNVYLGEYGIPENEFSGSVVKTVVADTIKTAVEWGCPYVVYWQLYCNENYKEKVPPVKDNKDVRGFWLVRPDGTTTWQWDYLKGVFESGRYPR